MLGERSEDFLFSFLLSFLFWGVKCDMMRCNEMVEIWLGIGLRDILSRGVFSVIYTYICVCVCERVYCIT